MLKNLAATELNQGESYDQIIWKINTLFIKLAKVPFDKNFIKNGKISLNFFNLISSQTKC